MATDLLTAEMTAAGLRGIRQTNDRAADDVRVASDGGGTDGAGECSGKTSPVSCDAEQSVAAEVTASVWSVQLGDVVELTKPRIVVMILVTTLATAMIGAGGWVSVVDLFWLLLATAAVAGSAGAANQVWERVIDQRMTRTANRPLPAGRLSTGLAATVAGSLGLLGTALLFQLFGFVPAAVGLATWVLYVLVYTPMKTRTAWNTTVGAVAGALPVMIGYTATGGGVGDFAGWLLVGVLVAWQYPHFMAIAWMYRRQYAEAGFRMTTTVEPTGRSAGWQSIVGSLALIFCGVAHCLLSGSLAASLLASLGVILSTWPMLKASVRFAKLPDDGRARRLLRSSLLVLPAVLAIATLQLFW